MTDAEFKNLIQTEMLPYIKQTKCEYFADCQTERAERQQFKGETITQISNIARDIKESKDGIKEISAKFSEEIDKVHTRVTDELQARMQADMQISKDIDKKVDKTTLFTVLTIMISLAGLILLFLKAFP